MSDYKNFLLNIKNSLNNDLSLYENIYSKIEPINLTGNALICSTRCSMNISENKRENGIKISNTGILSIQGSGTTTVNGSIQSNLNISNNKENFEFYKILFFLPQFHKINNIKNNGEMHIIFKDTKSNKYQINCILINEKKINLDEELSEKLVDEYITNNIPNKIKGEKTIIKPKLNWYLTDLIPNNKSYYSYILTNNNNVLVVLYENTINLSTKFINKLKNDVFKKNNYKFKYNKLNNDNALFYTYDSMKINKNINKNIKNITNNIDVKENFDKNNTEIIYNKNKSSDEFKNIIENIEKNNNILEHATNNTINYDDEIEQPKKCHMKKSNTKIILFIVFLSVNILFIIVFLIMFYYKYYFAYNLLKKNNLLENNNNNETYKSKIIELFRKSFLNYKKNNKSIKINFIIYIFLTIFITIYLFTNYDYSIINNIFILITFFIILSIGIYYSIIFYPLKFYYHISNKTDDLRINLYNNSNENNKFISVGFIDDSKINRNKELNTWLNILNNLNIIDLNEWKNKLKKYYSDSIFNEILNDNTNNLNELKILKLSVVKKKNEVENKYKKLNKKFDENILNDINYIFENNLEQSFVESENYKKFQNEKWYDIINDENNIIKLIYNFNDVKNKLNNMIDDHINTLKNIYNDIDSLDKNIQTNYNEIYNFPKPPSISQSGGNLELYENKKIKNTKIIKQILKKINFKKNKY